jgi:hypothetical protein
MVGARRFAEGGSTKSSEESDLNPFGSDEETTRKLNEIYPPKKPKPKPKSKPQRMAKGGKTAHYAKGGMVGKASKRADGCAVKGKTKGKMR